MENPSGTNAANVPTSDTGTASMGMSVARKLPRKRNTTSSTRMMASRSACTTSSMEALTKSVLSMVTSYSRPGGNLSPSSSIRSRSCPAVSMALEPGSW